MPSAPGERCHPMLEIRDNRLPMSKMMTIGILPSWLKTRWYRSRGYKIGERVSFGPGSVLDVSGTCEIGDDCAFGAGSVIGMIAW